MERKKNDLKKELERFPTFEKELREYVHWIRQTDKAVMIITCTKIESMSFSNKFICLAVNKGKYNTISIITKCKENIPFPHIKYSHLEIKQQFELACIKTIQANRQKKRIYIDFKVQDKKLWQIQFFKKDVFDSWISRMEQHFGLKIKPTNTEQQKVNTQFQLQQVLPFAPENMMSINELKDMDMVEFVKNISLNLAFFTFDKIIQIINIRQSRFLQLQLHYRKEYNKLSQKISTSQTSLQEKSVENNKLKKNVETISAQLKIEQEKYLDLQNKFKRERFQKECLQKKKGELQSFNNQKENLIKQLNAEHQKKERAANQIIAEANALIAQLKLEIEKQNTEIILLKQEGLEKNREISTKIEELQLSMKKIDEIKEHLDEATKKLQANKKLAEEEKNKQSERRNVQSLKLREMTSKLEVAESIVKQNIDRINQLSEERLFHIFEQDALHDCNHEKLYLCNQIQDFSNNKVKYTKLLCFLDPHNKTNFHHYIDGKPNICCVIRTEGGNSLAGFSRLPFSRQSPAINGGILVSMSNKKTYKCREGKRALTYDDFYAIFGNSEIRIRTNENELFSNIGIATAFYDNLGDKVTDFIGECKERVSKIKHYEFYEVIFE